MQGKIFGTDGIRGRANLAPMSVEIALALGKAAGKVFRRHDGKHRVVIGKDTRLSGYMFENALIAGLCSMGIDTLMVGPLPTPGVAFITRAYRADAGIVISASHNPFYDNGIKFFSSEGFKLPDEVEEEIEKLVLENDFSDSLPAYDDLGRNTRVHDAQGRYIEFTKATFPRALSLDHMRIVLDCANGAAYSVAPLVFKELDATLFVLCNTPNGLNINDHCGSLHPEGLIQSVKSHRADVGIALDGDGDRIIMVDERGEIVDGDTLLAICALDRYKKGLLTNNLVVGTVMTNFGIISELKKRGIDLIEAPVGDRHVIQKMREHGANLGGEQSGHLIFLDHITTGDGLVSALQVLRIMIETQTKLSQLTATFKKIPQACINVKVQSKPPLDSLDDVKSIIKKVTTSLSDQGRVLIRYSGTENLCRVMVECPQVQQAQDLANQIATVVQNSIGIRS